jgi:hypothetical protein
MGEGNKTKQTYQEEHSIKLSRKQSVLAKLPLLPASKNIKISEKMYKRVPPSSLR